MPRGYYTTVCAHLSGDLHRENLFTEVFRCQLAHLADMDESCERCSGLARCSYCPTEVLVEAKRLDTNSRGGFLIITKWQLLGCGRSPSEASWKDHLERPIPPWSSFSNVALGSIRDGFEDQPGVKYDSILDLDTARKLLSGR